MEAFPGGRYEGKKKREKGRRGGEKRKRRKQGRKIEVWWAKKGKWEANKDDLGKGFKLDLGRLSRSMEQYTPLVIF